LVRAVGFAARDNYTEYGMPSSHSQLMWFVATYLAFFVLIRVYLQYHTWAQVCWGALIGSLLACLWFSVTQFVLTPLFPRVVSWPVSELLMLRDTTLIPNVMWFEYTSYRAESRSRDSSATVQQRSRISPRTMLKKPPSSSSLNRTRWSVAEQTAEDPSSRYLCGKGTIHFWKNFAFESEGRPYIRVTHDIGIEEVLNVFTREWKFTLPRIVLVIISSLTTWQEWSAPRQLENFKAGLIKAANTTAMWIMTNGVNTGIAKEVGAWVNEELVQRLIMRCHRHPHTDFEKMPPLCLLGIVREDLLTCADKFDANKDGAIFIENVGSRPEENRFDLNPDHTHFIVVKDDTVNKTGLNYFMLKLEKHLSMTCEDDSAATLRHGCVDPRTLCSAEIPLIAVVCQGGTGCNKMVLEHIKKQLPILVIQGSGGVADLLALAYNEIDRRGVTLWDPEFIENVLKPELSSRICQMFPKFRDNAISRNVFKDRIVECLRLACQTQEQMYFTVINIHHHRNNLQHLDDILLKAVFK
ncbi:hypothetical protein HPB47_025774, partial [Ixodes persulcatus]